MTDASGFCDNCFKVCKHEGESTGTYETIGGVKCYVATPQGDYPKDKVVLFLTDVFGIELVNNRLLVDGFAENGFRTIAPDILNGDARSPETMGDASFDRAKWVAAHGPDSWTPVLDAVVAALKAQGVARFGTTGYCFGAPPAFYLAFKNEAHVTVLAHPSRLDCPADLEKYRDVSKAPLLINTCEVDPAFPLDRQAIADEIFGNGKFAPGYERTYWEGCTHGFAVKGDLSNPKIKAGKEGAFKASVDFFKKYL
ncbi:alpha/beta hydrolase [Phanerochaete sordida]|uniref:Alpha/beta hydrolase n=1 Tax=Phanerochaete sordida TaxID=48140 RepID=A0A9P3G8P0_9APHY|nr:alpha/beta hydrolase [Phanerochaete sordida]